jgi:hypothetical protein
LDFHSYIWFLDLFAFSLDDGQVIELCLLAFYVVVSISCLVLLFEVFEFTTRQCDDFFLLMFALVVYHHLYLIISSL